LEERLRGLGEALDVTGEAAVDASPGEGALDDPALGLDDEAGVGALDDLDGTRRSGGDARPLVAGVREDALNEREAPGDPLENQRRAVAILHAGGTDLDAQHQAKGVGDQVSLAALDPLSRVVSDHFSGFRAGFHALAVDDRRRGALVAALQPPGSAIEHIVEVRPNPVRDPGPEVAIDGAAGREVPRQPPPRRRPARGPRAEE